jgi:hypothetical protein
MLKNIEKAPWRVEISRNAMGRVSHIRVLAAEPRHVYVSTMQAETVRDHVGNVNIKPGTTPTIKTIHDEQLAVVCNCGMAEEPVIVCDCGISYVGLSSETLLAHGDLIAAAPELYEALERCILLIDPDDGDELTPTATRIVSEARAALAKARGEHAE